MRRKHQEIKMTSPTIVLYPSPGMGHLVAMVELGKFILHHHPSLSITVLISPPSFNTGSTMDYVRHISATVPSISFHHLPTISLDLLSFPSMEAVIFELLRLSSPHVRSALDSLSRATPISAFVIDFFCTASLPIAADLHIPTYFFVTSGACVVAFFTYLPVIHNSTTESFKDMNRLLHIPGVPPIPSSDMMRPMLDRTWSEYQNLLNFANEIPNSAGLIVNTFESLEPKPLQAIREGKCNPGGNTPPVFCVGPLLNTENQREEYNEVECMKWLEKQPSKSVVYICLGSLGLLSAAQLSELAVGLERSGKKFLWVVRSPPTEDKSRRYLKPPEPDLEELLPAGFVERMGERGMVVKSWAPQVAVLGHAAVGGFVTHCGWNSILEAVCAGVPMAAWPMYAEQHFNRVVLVEDMKVAVRVVEDEEGFVSAEEVEKRVVELMEGAEEVRREVEKKSVEAREAMANGGSSVAALGKMVELWTSA
ncbi:LOW QUALITY PROTEIN: UDP-glycosyltransferase 88B1-like [Salvia splendens]|uniref:LOW QUALITY PROTEIN: UDP-glycosyltransferase 88B1-like n=1 Tax=Salvia splendens TaxID=180675 RepID=UPI001C276EEF|nr:LOW QUALITY PROTEIN: UDP-glycosyltransferase 88B1-like [Salvia splendens]